MYRPEGWDNPHKLEESPCTNPAHGIDSHVYRDNLEVIDTCEITKSFHRRNAEIYEAGADAMLEGLKSGDTMEITNGVITIPGFLSKVEDIMRNAGNGSWVFIPGGKE